MVETPIKNGAKHGMEYSWDNDSSLSLAEPYHKGLVHGTARQWDSTGALMGTYTLTHGTGYDLWRQPAEKGGSFIHEIHPMKDGLPHGYEWWLNEDRSLSEEIHWNKGRKHGVERNWGIEGNLEPGFPKFLIENREVNKREYLGAQAKDNSLPEYLKQDDSNTRTFPEEIVKTMKST